MNDEHKGIKRKPIMLKTGSNVEQEKVDRDCRSEIGMKISSENKMINSPLPSNNGKITSFNIITEIEPVFFQKEDEIRERYDTKDTSLVQTYTLFSYGPGGACNSQEENKPEEDLEYEFDKYNFLMFEKTDLKSLMEFL